MLLIDDAFNDHGKQNNGGNTQLRSAFIFRLLFLVFSFIPPRFVTLKPSNSLAKDVFNTLICLSILESLSGNF